MKYSINTNCLKNDFSIAEIVALAKNTAVDGIEWGLPPWEKIGSNAEEMAARTRDAGLEMVGFINSCHAYDMDGIKRYSELALQNGAPMLRVDPPWFAWDRNEALHQQEKFLDHCKIMREALEKLVEPSRQYHVRYVVEIHAGSIFASPWAVHFLMSGLDPAAVGAIWDPANMMIEGQVRPTGAVELFGRHLAYVHVKNLEWQRTCDNQGWTFQRKTIDCGLVDYAEIAFALKLAKYDGYLSFEELCTGKENFAAEIKNGIKYLKNCFAEAPDCITMPFIDFNHLEKAK